MALVLERNFLGTSNSISEVLLDALRFHAQVNLKKLFPPTVALDVLNYIFDGSGTVVSEAIRVSNEAIREEKVVALLGTWTSATTSYVAVSANFGLPPTAMCSGSATSTELNKRALYGNFFRTVPDDQAQAAAVVAFITSRKWGRFSMIYTSDQYGEKLANAIQVLAKQQGIYILDYVPITALQQDYDASIARLSQSGASVFVAIAYTDQMIGILKSAKARNLLRDGYAWIGTDSNKVQWNNYTNAYAELFPGLIITSPLRCLAKECIAFEEQWKNANVALYPYAGQALPPFGYYYLDCVSNIGYGLARFMQQNSSRSWDKLANGEYNGELVAPGVYETWSFPEVQGYTSNLGVSLSGDPQEIIYALFNWRNKSLIAREAVSSYEDYWAQVGSWTPINGLVIDQPIVYPPGNVTTTPPDRPIDPQCTPGNGAVNTTNGGLVCAACPNGSFNRDYSSICHVCPEGGFCPGATSVKTRPGWWMDPNTATQSSPVLYSCQRFTTCCDVELGCDWTNQCPGGHIGRLCAECPIGLYSWSGVCLECNPGINALIAVILLFAAWIFLIVVILLSRTSNVIISEISFFFQVCYLVLDESIGRRFLGLFSLESSSLSTEAIGVCVFPLTDYGRLMVDFLYPTLLLLLYFCIWGGCLLWQRWRCCLRCVPKKMQEMELNVIMRTGSVLILLFVYLPFVRNSLNVFACRSVAGVSVNRAHPSVECWTGRHIASIVMAIVFLLACCIGIPLVLTSVVFRIRKAEAQGVDPHTDLAHYPSVYHLEKYRRQRWWFFCIGQLVERTIIILVSVAFSFDEYAYEQGFAVVFLVGVVALLIIWPYSAWYDNVFKGLIYACWIGILTVRLSRHSASFWNQFPTNGVRASTYSLVSRILEGIYLVVPVVAFIVLAWFQWGHFIVRAGQFMVGKINGSINRKPKIIVATADDHGLVEAVAVANGQTVAVSPAELGRASRELSIVGSGTFSQQADEESSQQMDLVINHVNAKLE